jgi:hypothetical protein
MAHRKRKRPKSRRSKRPVAEVRQLQETAALFVDGTAALYLGGR